MIIAVFEWSDGYAATVRYPKSPKKDLLHNGVKPSQVKLLINEASSYSSDMAIWFSKCYSILNKKVVL